MSIFEYKVVPAPVKGRKGKGTKGAQGRFALALETAINELAAEGWEYLRTDTLPSEERSGLTGSTTVFHNMLVFRRAVAVGVPLPEPTRPAELKAPAEMPPLVAAAPAGKPAAPEMPVPSAAPVPPTPPAPPAASKAATDGDQTAAAAAAAAAALSAYRDALPEGAPTLGPARREKDDGNVAAE
ncbi:DUF4177 domain-containing protein [Tropicimonas marinistellae]|uniref:DUF4177 domain-containing protein n=1 Tax=Tropicimonas marinistellae TaxID=1739787 RepID=UPI00082D5D9E|nr:DUF4177 domain-containing protein [Tropicimonas marinistellae]